MARIVLVHGAFGGAAVWERVAPALRGAGHTVETVDLPGPDSDGTSAGEVTLDGYAAHVCDTLAQGPPAVLVGHSMGGVVITQAAARCPQEIAQLVYVAAFIPQDGQSLIALTQLPEAAGDQVQAKMVVEGDPPVAVMPVEAAPEALFGSCDEPALAWALRTLRRQPVAPFAAPVELGGGGRTFAALPRAYVSCLQDRAVLPALQRRMLAGAGCDPVIELPTDHCPWASCPDALADALVRIAG